MNRQLQSYKLQPQLLLTVAAALSLFSSSFGRNGKDFEKPRIPASSEQAFSKFTPEPVEISFCAQRGLLEYQRQKQVTDPPTDVCFQGGRSWSIIVC